MSDRTFASIANALADLFMDDITSSINRAVVLAQLLDTRDGTGKNVQWDVKFGTATPAGAVIADGADVSTFNLDDKIPAVLQYGTYHDAFAITGKSAAAAAATGNPDQLSDLFADDMLDSVTRLASAIGAAVYTGSGATDNMHGLTASSGPLDTTGTYAGIDRSTYPQWASNEIDAAAGALSFALMRQMRRTIYTGSGLRPDLIICDPEQHENYGSLFGTDRRYVDEIRMRGQTIRLDGGYQVLEFDGIPVIEDVQAPANQMLFLNSSHLYLSQLPDPVTALNQSMGLTDLMGTNEEQYGEGPIGLRARILPLARTGDLYKFSLYTYPALVSRRNNCHGALVNLA